MFCLFMSLMHLFNNLKIMGHEMGLNNVKNIS